MGYEIQHNTFVDGWVNTSTTTDTDGNEARLVFDSHAEAQAELDDYMGEINDQIASGQREPEHGYDPDEFRIREVRIMTDFMDTALNYQPGIRIAPDAKRWVITNGIGQMPVCDVCAQPIYEGHIDCTCDKNHPENCDRLSYGQLQEHLRRIAGENMDFAVTYRKVLQALLDRHNARGNTRPRRLLTILSPLDIEEIETALETR